MRGNKRVERKQLVVARRSVVGMAGRLVRSRLKYDGLVSNGLLTGEDFWRRGGGWQRGKTRFLSWSLKFKV